MEKTGHGLILGKFLPPHAGHQYLVHFAQNFVERLTVLVCSLDREPIPGQLRYAWMRELFPQARIVHVTDELPQEPSEHPQFWDMWRTVVLDAAGEPIDYVFASEDYGHRLAPKLGRRSSPSIRAAKSFPSRARRFATRPLTHWQYIPECVRPYFVKRVCIFGPESTGKSTLARDLAAHFDTVYVPEFARGLLDPKQGVCDASDIPLIARGQAAAEDAARAAGQPGADLRHRPADHDDLERRALRRLPRLDSAGCRRAPVRSVSAAGCRRALGRRLAAISTRQKG